MNLTIVLSCKLEDARFAPFDSHPAPGPVVKSHFTLPTFTNVAFLMEVCCSKLLVLVTLRALSGSRGLLHSCRGPPHSPEHHRVVVARTVLPLLPSPTSPSIQLPVQQHGRSTVPFPCAELGLAPAPCTPQLQIHYLHSPPFSSAQRNQGRGK